MKYTSDYFDIVTNRLNTVCAKYDGLEFMYGSKDLMPMWIADMDFRCPVELIDAIEDRASHGIYGYGLLGLFYTEYVSKWHDRRNNISYSSSNIHFLRGTLSGINITLLALTKENDNVMLITPTYNPLKERAIDMNRNVIESHLIKIDGCYVFDYDDIKQKIITNNIKLFILCNPHNPTGRVWSEQELEKLFVICQKYDVAILSDEVHSDLIMPNNTFVPAIKIARKIQYNKIVMISSPSKTFNVAGINAGYYIVEREEYENKLKKAASYVGSSDLLGPFIYTALKVVYETGDDYVSGLISYLYDNYGYLSQELRGQSWANNIVMNKLEATYLVWIELCNTNFDNVGIKKMFVKHGIALETGKDFHEIDGTFIRINIGAPRSIIIEATKKIVNCLNEIYEIKA